MELTCDLRQRRDAVLGRWFDLIIATYPPESSRLLRKNKDRFSNPIGYSISEGIERVYDQIVSTMDCAELRSALDEVIRVRAIQDFTPSQAVGFVFLLKAVIRDVLKEKNDTDKHGHANEMAALDTRIDKVAMIAFDVYMERRERFHEIRASEIKKSSIRLIERLNQRPDRFQNKGEPIDDVG
jgi:hypothetical protein